MPLIQKPNYNQVFASQAPDIDKPAVFNNYPEGWGPESRPNNGKPTIKGFNYLQRTSDLKDLWILQNGACLPYDESIEYADGAPVLKDGVIQYKTASGFSPVISEKPYILNYFTEGTSYPLNARVMLDNGDIVKSTIDGNTNNPNVDMTGWMKGWNNGVESMDALRLLNPKNGDQQYLLSVNEGQNEGGGTFVATQKVGLVDNGGTIISSTNPLLFWVRVNYSDVTFEMFGAKGNDPAFDDYDAIQRCVNSVDAAVMAGKWYYISEGIEIPDEFKKLTGVSQNVSRIVKTTNHKKTVANGDSIDYTLYTLPAVAGDPNTYYKTFSDFEIRKTDELFLTPNSYGLYCNKLALSLFKNIRILKFETGFHSLDTWMTTYERVTVHAGKDGFYIKTGTSNVMNACWVISPTGTAYRFENTLYSVMIGCGCDFAGMEGAPAEAIISASWSELAIIGMGYEKCHLQGFGYFNGSKVHFTNIRGLLNENKYATGYGAWIAAENESKIVFDGGTFGLKYNKSSAGVSGVPNAVYLASNSTLDDRNTDLFKNYTLTDIQVGYGNLTTDVDGYKREIIKSTTATDKKILSDRVFVSNNGFSVSQKPDDVRDNGSYYYNAAGAMGYMMIQHIAHGSSRAYAWQFGVAAGEPNLSSLTGRVKSDGVWSTPVKILNGNNTTVDSNGFVKAASPIVKLYADRIELNDEAEQQGITFEKIDTGAYLIKGSSGFAQEGWYIETPKDANGNVLFSVIYTTLENGDISVKTYKKKFDIELAAIVADLDNPMDITESRWIDLRLHEVQEIIDVPAYPEDV